MTSAIRWRHPSARSMQSMRSMRWPLARSSAAHAFPPRRRLTEFTRGLIAVGGAVGGLLISLVNHGHDFHIAPTEAIVLVLASLALTLRWMLALIAVAATCVLTSVLLAGEDEAALSAGAVLGLLAVAVVAVIGATRREVLGLGPIRAESVIAQLRAQLVVQGAAPQLPAGWHVDIEQRAAHGAAIAGDFICSRVHDVGGNLHLDMVVVDVSGKGIEAGTRALLLSGAMGGLLGAVGPDEFLAESNNYLRRQSWAEGFASAVYIRVNLDSGLYSVRSAGHPPALQMDASSGTWRPSRSAGTVLGVLPAVRIRADYRTMRSGDALLLYTDGVVEDPQRDLDWGTERLMSAAQALVGAGATGKVARRLVDDVPTRLDDDRAVVMVWRDSA